MLKKRHQRLAAILLTLTGLGIAVALILTAMQENLLYYATPTQLATDYSSNPSDHKAKKKHHLGGMVKSGSVIRVPNSTQVSFTLTDYTTEVAVSFDGILPDLFREEQGIVAIGTYQDGQFQAQKVLAKHDENYMPPDIKTLHEKNKDY